MASDFELGAEALVFDFEVGDALAGGGEEVGEFLLGVAGGDVLGAVPVEGFEGDRDGAFGRGFFGWVAQLGEERCGFGPFVDGGVAEDFEAGLVGVVHEEEGDAVVMEEVSGGDVLLVAAEVGEGEGAVVEDVEEAGVAATELHVGPSGFADSGHVEAVAGAEEGLLVWAQEVAWVT